MDDATLAALVREVGKRELGEDDETREHALTQFRDWVVKNPNIRNCRTDDNFLLGFLRVRKFSIQNAQQSLLRFLDALQKVPKISENLDCLDPKIEILHTNRSTYVCPIRDAQGRLIKVESFGNSNVAEHSYVDYGRSQLTTIFTMMEDPVAQVMGYVYIYDLANTSAAHATFWPLTELLTFMKFFEKATPIRHKEIHVINLNPVLKVWFNIILYATSKKIQNRVHMHDSLEDLHKKVNPELLPKEFGGKLSAEEIIGPWKQKMLECRHLVLGMSEMRLLGDNGGEAVETGSFRKLAID